VKRRWAGWRDWLRGRRVANVAYRVAVAVVGLAVLAAGILAIPYPGPGAAIVIVGLGILATEFSWARRWLTIVKVRYDAVMAWVARQHISVRILIWTFTAAVAVATLWLVGVIGWLVSLAGVEWPWLQSPIGRGR
jgi:uncharacterized protein (TIGR02611 family)